MNQQAIELLSQLGFSSYEAKAYIGILAGQPVGAYELAKRSGVPTSKIYETMTKLLNREVVQFAGPSNDNPTYVALPPEDLSQRLNQQIANKTSALLPLLEPLASTDTPDFIWPVQTIEDLKERTKTLIQTAKEGLLISCWAEELSWFEEELVIASNRGVAIALVHFGIPGKEIGATYYHPVEKTLYAEKGGRGLTLVADSQQVLIATLKDQDKLDACWSRNQAFVTVAEDYVKHDVYITKVTRHLNREMTERYGSDYEKLRNIYNPEA